MIEEIKKVIGDHQILIASGSLALVGTFWIFKGTFKNFQERRDLNRRRLRKQQDREKQFKDLEKLFPHLTNEAKEIVQLSFEELQDKLASRELSAKKVLEAFVTKTLMVTREFNCVTEFVPQSWEWAEQLDKMSELKGPLHGMPICVKDNQDIEGMDSTLGMSLNLYRPANKNDPMVQQLIDAGGIPFCKTNIPQTLLSVSSDNPIYGTTRNHLNKKLSPGGSSSGTACLVGAGGAPFGIGTDLGGSLRIPAHFSGICTLRPTLGRVCGKGVTERTVTIAGLSGVHGVLTKRAKTMVTIYKLLIGDSSQLQYDPLIVPIPWNEMKFSSTKALRIGYLTSMPFFPSIGDTPGTILNAKNILEKLGHNLIPFELPDNLSICNNYLALALADGRWGYYNRLKNDQVANTAKKFFRGKTFRSFLWESFKSLMGMNCTTDFKRNAEEITIPTLWMNLEKQKRIKYGILQKMAAFNIDILLMPVFPFPAPLVDDMDMLINGIIYTVIWNLCDFPVAVIPFGQESCQNVDDYDDQNNFYFKLAKKGIHNSQNMPIGIQLVGKPFDEEILLRISVQLDEYKLSLAKSNVN